MLHLSSHDPVKVVDDSLLSLLAMEYYDTLPHLFFLSARDHRETVNFVADQHYR